MSFGARLFRIRAMIGRPFMMFFLIQTYEILGAETHFAAAGLKLFLSELSSSEAHKPENGGSGLPNLRPRAAQFH